MLVKETDHLLLHYYIFQETGNDGIHRKWGPILLLIPSAYNKGLLPNACFKNLLKELVYFVTSVSLLPGNRQFWSEL